MFIHVSGLMASGHRGVADSVNRGNVVVSRGYYPRNFEGRWYHSCVVALFVSDSPERMSIVDIRVVFFFSVRRLLLFHCMYVRESSL